VALALLVLARHQRVVGRAQVQADCVAQLLDEERSVLALGRVIDELHLERPFAGSRMLRDLLRARGVNVGRKDVATLMRRMGIEALCRTPNTCDLPVPAARRGH
jgi:hypothetical protein